MIDNLLFLGVLAFFGFIVWLCHEKDEDYIEANPDDSTELIEHDLFGDKNENQKN